MEIEKEVQENDGAGEGEQEIDPKAETAAQLKARLGGLNSAYNKKQAEWNGRFTSQQNVIADQATKLKDAEARIAELAKEADTLKSKQPEFEKSVGELSTKAATLEATVARQRLFMLPPSKGGFSDLAEFEADDLLRKDLTGDELTAHLAKYRETITSKQAAAIKDGFKGVVPAAGSTHDKEAGTLDSDSLQAQMNDAMAKGDWKLYDQLNSEWIKLSLKK